LTETKKAKLLTIDEWMEKTRPNFKGNASQSKRVELLKKMRDRVFKRAGTSRSYLAVAKSRDNGYSEALIERMAKATETEPEGYRIARP